MSFISCSQNNEDVILWRALKHIDKGFYIDVGVNDPKIDSVTKAFYDRGWCDINIELISHWHDKLLKERLNDINLKIAVGSHKGTIVIYDIPGIGMSTSNKSFAEEHERNRNIKSNAIKAPQDTLTAIIKKYDHQNIHFLKIDVEGVEKDIIQGLDMQKIRPWIIVVEVFLLTNPIESHEEWEGSIFSANYKFVYSDENNRFYISQKKSELLRSFHYPPNILEKFNKIQQLKAESRLQKTNQHVKQTSLQQLKAIFNSRSCA